jgi:hypothetical protein
MQKQANWNALANICSGIKPIMVLLSRLKKLLPETLALAKAPDET